MNHGTRELMRLIDKMEARSAVERESDFAALPVHLMLRLTTGRIWRGVGRRLCKQRAFSQFMGSLPWIGREYRRRTLLARSSRHTEFVCGPETDLCIEAFPRSANSFFYVWFKLTNPRQRIAHHTHSVENVRLAFDYGIPLVILIRNPLEAVASFALYQDSPLEERRQFAEELKKRIKEEPAFEEATSLYKSLIKDCPTE